MSRSVRAAERYLEADEEQGRSWPAELGQPTVREVIEPPYRIVYRGRAEVLEVVAAVHGAQRFSADRLP